MFLYAARGIEMLRNGNQEKKRNYANRVFFRGFSKSPQFYLDVTDW